MLRIWLLSDLHDEIAENRAFEPAPPDADLLIAAGDIYEGDVITAISIVDKLRGPLPAIFVPGNHEFWGWNFSQVAEAGREQARRRGVHYLDGDIVTVNGIKIAGVTLWCGADPNDVIAADRTAILNDPPFADLPSQPFGEPVYVAGPSTLDRRAKNADIHRRHAADIRFLRQSEADVVVTHYPPTPSGLAGAANAQLWAHGHDHHSSDIRHGDTRIVCNPRGMTTINPDFKRDLVITVKNR
jgi:predicted phosphodiesterase